MRALACLLLLAGVAAANPPPRPDTQNLEGTVLVGIGPRIATGYTDAVDDRSAAAAAELLLGFHMSPAISIGVHVGIAHHAQSDGFGDLPHDDYGHNDRSIVPLDVGLALQYAQGRFSLAPWAGRHFTRYS